MKDKISVVITTYNEKGNVEELVKRLFALNYNIELVAVDDNSPDGTGKILDNLAKKYNIKVIHRKEKLGVASAQILAFENATGDIIGIIDTDLSHPPELIPKLVNPIINNEADIVVGSRYTKGGETKNWPLSRKLYSRAAIILTKAILPKLTDPTSGIFFFRKEVLEGVNLKPSDFKIGLNIFVKGKHNSIKEIPYIFVDRTYGKSKHGLVDGMIFFSQVLELYWYKLMRRKNGKKL